LTEKKDSEGHSKRGNTYCIRHKMSFSVVFFSYRWNDMCVYFNHESKKYRKMKKKSNSLVY